MEHLISNWLKRAERLRASADKTQNEMTEQAFLAEAYSVEVCADELKRAIDSNTATEANTPEPTPPGTESGGG